MQDDLAMTATMTDYMRSLEEQVERIYELARLARKKGIDPKQEPEILLTKDLAARVEGVIGPSGVSALIRKLATKMSREEIAFKVAEEIVNGRFGSLDAQQAAEQAIRTGLAILTEGKTAAPLEGIGQVKVKQNRDGTAYLAIYFAGPIRAAGGTETALTVVLGDFVRRLLHLDQYKPIDAEVERYVEEIPLYARVCHLQVPTTPEEIRKAAQNLPVEITGEPTETAEVSGFRDLERVETNRLRGGMALVLNDGVIGRARKILALLDKIGLEQWEWLRELKQTRSQKLRREGGEIALQPKSQYLRDVIAGRPIFSHPSRRGGFRVRYGRSRNTGLAAVGLHPATMALLSEFLAIGTQMLTEKPGKGAIISAVDSIEGPLVKLKNGDVLRINSLELAVKIRNDMEEILYLGDILIGFGEFLENNHWLVPAGYCPEWWIQEFYRGIRTHCNSSLHDAANQTGIAKERLEIFLNNYFWSYPTEIEAIQLARSLKIPLHPCYTYFWEDLTIEEFFTLQRWLRTASWEKDDQNGFLRKIMVNTTPKEKIILEKLGIPHKMKQNQIEIIEGAATLGVLLDLFSNTSDNDMRQQLEESTPDLNGLNLVTLLSGIILREKRGTQIGGRMGRPEKSRERKMRPPVHGLFPIELSGGPRRNIYTIIKQRKCVLLEIVVRICPNCKNKTHLPTCPNCKEPTIPVKRCQKCGRPPASTEDTSCPSCGGTIVTFEKRDVDVAALLKGVREKIPQLPPLIKGVKRLINPTKEPEALEKVVLRATHNVFVYKDGTIRYDATDAPLTHFYPNEIGIDVKTIKTLGYTHDIYGNPITTEDQCLELKPQDIIVSERSGDYLLRVAHFVDDLLQRVYNLPPFYNTKSKRDLIGHLVIGLAPHTSCGIIGRIIGFTKAQVHFAHPYWHAAKRRNCLVGTEEVPIWDTEKKELILTSISEIIEKSIQKGATQEIVDNFGTIAFQNLYPQWRVMSIDEKTKKPIMQPIKHWIKGKHNHWVKIRTETGRTLKMTPEHMALVWNPYSKTITKTKAIQLVIGDYIPILTKPPLPVQQPPSRVNILKELADNLSDNDKFQTFKHMVRLRCAAEWMKTKLLNYAHNHSKFHLNKPYKRLQPQVRKHIISILPQKPYKNPLSYDWYNSIPLSHLEALQQEGIFNWDEIPVDAKLGMARDDLTISPYIPFTTDFMRLLGYFIAEGYIRDERSCYQINFCVPNSELRNHVNKLINDLLGSSPYYKKDNHQLVHTGRIHAYLFAYAWKIGKDAFTKRIPSFIYTLPSDYSSHFISAVIDGDGSIIPRSCRTTIYTGNNKLAQDYCLLLSTLGIFARLYKTKGGRYGRTVLERYEELGVEPKTDNPLFHVNIPGKENKLLFKHINLIHKKKQKKLEIILKKSFPEPRRFHKLSENVIADKIKEINTVNSDKPSYCLEVDSCGYLKPVSHNIVMLNCLTTGQCDGDEDAIILLLDGLLNFSRVYLPTTRGGMMDTPLVLSTLLDPKEVDSEAHNLDVGTFYPLEFYEQTLQMVHPEAVLKLLDVVEHRLGTDSQYEGFKFTHPTSQIDDGPVESAYVRFETMEEKIDAQLLVAKKVQAVDLEDTAQRVITHHLLRDLIGCLRAYGAQQFRCVSCNKKYRRGPLSGMKCNRCGGKIILTLSEGSVTKYYELATKLLNKYSLSDYLRTRLELLGLNIEQLFGTKREKHMDLGKFLKH
ncbi:MAG: DNA polymerase II large subunit [Candidatus Hodarchaeota archaeon]